MLLTSSSASRKRLVPALGIFLLIAPANAQISGDYSYDSLHHAYFVTGDTTIDGDISGNEVFVGKDNASSFATLSPTPPITVSVMGAADGAGGANITYFENAYPAGNPKPVYYYGLNVFGANNVIVSGGHVDELYGYDASRTTINGGSVNQVYTSGTSEIALSGGAALGVYGGGSGTINISGGTVFDAVLNFDSSTTNISGGTVNDTESRSASVVNISGGDVSAAFSEDASAIHISGGSVTEADSFDRSRVTIDGGNVTRLFAFDSSAFTIGGGVVGSEGIYLFDNSLLRLTGANLALSSAMETGADLYGDFTRYRLSGSLADGSPLDATLFDYDDDGYDIAGGGPNNTPLYFNGTPIFTSIVTAAPEPGTLALFALTLPLGIRLIRRGQK